METFSTLAKFLQKFFPSFSFAMFCRCVPTKFQQSVSTMDFYDMFPLCISLVCFHSGVSLSFAIRRNVKTFRQVLARTLSHSLAFDRIVRVFAGGSAL